MGWIKRQLQGGNKDASQKLKAASAQAVDAAAADLKLRTVAYWKLYRYVDCVDVLLMVTGTCAAVVNGMTLPSMLVIRSQLINNFGTAAHDPAQLKKHVSQDSLIFVYISTIAWLASYLEVSCWMRTGERQTARIRAKYLRAILRQNVGYFDNEVSTAEVVSNVSADTLLVQEAISEKVGNFIRNMTQFAGGFLVGFILVWRLAILMLPFTPLLILPGSFYGKALTDYAIRRQVAYNRAGTVAQQAISSVRTVYSFVGEKTTARAYSEHLEETVNLGLKQGLAKGLAIGSNGISFALWAFMAWYGSVLILQGRANGGQVLTTGFAVLIGGRALGYATPNLKAFSEGCTAAYRIFQMIERIPPIDIDDARGQQLAKVEGHLQLKDIYYAYPSRLDVTVLKNFNLQIPAGKTVALVGSSGSGKSTVISLLERFYDPNSGEVLLDGVNIKDLQLKWLHTNIGLVSQEPALFATSIRENILYGKEDATMDEIIEAAKSANAHKFIAKLPKGYDTQVGERGVQMSGGQKQRIAIARAMVKNPRVLLLDEATSALDSESEQIVQAALEKASVGRTTVVVAHRLSTIRSADVIAVVQSGKVIELGSHEELLSKGEGGAYVALVHLQQAARDGSSEALAVVDEDDLINLKDRDAQQAKLVTDSAKNTEFLDLSGSKRVSATRKPAKASFRRLLALNREEWKQAAAGMLGAIGFGFVQPFYAFLLGSMVSTYYDNDPQKIKAQTKTYSAIFVSLAAASFIVNVIQHYNFAVMGEFLTKRIREKMLETVLKFEIGWFDRDENSSGAICSRLASDANMVRSLIGDRISFLLQTASAIAVSFIIGLATSWRLALLMIAIQPLIIGCYYVKKICLQGFAQKAAKAQQEASQVASEAVSQHRTVTAFCSQDRVLALFASKLEISMKDIVRRSHIAGFGLGVAQFVLYTSWAVEFWYGGLLVERGQTTFGDVFKTFFVLVSTGRVLAEAGTMTPDLAKGATAVESVFEILDRKTEINGDDPRAEKPGKLRGDVELFHVNFAYPSRPDVIIFKNFNLGVNAGRTVALVGQSGSGKSTIIGLVERFYDPLSGSVMIDGKNIKNYHLHSLRQQIGLVSQEPTLFAASIRENIAYGKDDPTEAEIIEAARAANAHSFISALPDGYSTFAGEGGTQLSGGQKQRIAIARAILKNPAILLLDEATSALDSESERIVQEALERMMVSRSTIVVAHRLSTIQNAHTIAVIQEGSVVEKGSHTELLAKGQGGAYFSLVHLQNAAA